MGSSRGRPTRDARLQPHSPQSGVHRCLVIERRSLWLVTSPSRCSHVGSLGGSSTVAPRQASVSQAPQSWQSVRSAQARSSAVAKSCVAIGRGVVDALSESDPSFLPPGPYLVLFALPLRPSGQGRAAPLRINRTDQALARWQSTFRAEPRHAPDR